MSRRQSCVSIDARQNDTLLEFENCACSQRGVPRPPSRPCGLTLILSCLPSQEEIPPCQQAHHQVRAVVATVILNANTVAGQLG